MVDDAKTVLQHYLAATRTNLLASTEAGYLGDVFGVRRPSRSPGWTTLIQRTAESFR